MADNATDVARNASLANLAQYVLAINAENIVDGEAKRIFGLVQQVAGLILLDQMRGYNFQHTDDEKKGKKNEPHKS